MGRGSFAFGLPNGLLGFFSHLQRLESGSPEIRGRFVIKRRGSASLQLVIASRSESRPNHPRISAMVPHRVHCAVNAAFNSIGDAIGEHRLAIWFTNKNDVYGRLCQVRRLPAGARGPPVLRKNFNHVLHVSSMHRYSISVEARCSADVHDHLRGDLPGYLPS